MEKALFLVGALLMPTVDSSWVERHQEEIRSQGVRAGLLAWDAMSAPELKALRTRLDELTGAEPKKRFLLAVDHEGGPLFTQKTLGLSEFPGNMSLGAAGDPHLAYQAALVSARELKSLGVDVVFAPVLDVNSNPQNPIIAIRSFGDDPAAISRMGLAALAGYRDGGVVAVVKHFPGHGDTNVDSHTGLPFVGKSAKALEADLAPFRSAASSAPAFMTAHIRVPALGTGNDPATLSSAVLRGLLRERWGYEGVVFSDSLEMAAVAAAKGVPAAAAAAAIAGCDLLLTGRAPLSAVREELERAASEGRLDPALVSVSIERVNALSSINGLGDLPPIDAAELARTIAEGSIVLLRDKEALLPLKPEKGLLFVIFRPQKFAKEADFFRAELGRRFPMAEFRFVDSANPDGAGVLARAQAAERIIISSYHWGRSPEPRQAALVRRMLSLGKPAVLMSAMSPYDIPFYPEAKTALASFGMTRPALAAAARVLAGEIAPRGKLPASLGKKFPRGMGEAGFGR